MAAIKETKPTKRPETKPQKYKQEKTGGAQIRYKPYHAEQAKVLAEKGFTNTEMEQFWGICKGTLCNWRRKFPELDEAIINGKRYSNEKVKQALYGRALGFETTETKEESGTNGSKTTVTTRQVPADVPACRIWLYNRDRPNWSATPEKEDEETSQGASLDINFTVAEPISEVKITKGANKE